jgi:hypothetical protein
VGEGQEPELEIQKSLNPRLDMVMRQRVDLAWSVPGGLNPQVVPDILRPALDNHNIAHPGPDFEVKH